MHVRTQRFRPSREKFGQPLSSLFRGRCGPRPRDPEVLCIFPAGISLFLDLVRRKFGTALG
ncbi:hypothetical protein ACVNPS_06550 [Candidatus Bipolaricaulota sp. J31]